MDKWQLLGLKNVLTVREAAHLLTRNDNAVTEAQSLIIDAVEADELPAKIIRRGIYSADHGTELPGGKINEMETTIQRCDFDAWLSTKGASIDVSMERPDVHAAPASNFESTGTKSSTPAGIGKSGILAHDWPLHGKFSQKKSWRFSIQC
jgi:hypothetical protein